MKSVHEDAGWPGWQEDEDVRMAETQQEYNQRMKERTIWQLEQTGLFLISLSKAFSVSPDPHTNRELALALEEEIKNLQEISLRHNPPADLYQANISGATK